MKEENTDLKEFLHHTTASVEQAIDQLRRSVSRALRTNMPRQIAAYQGYNNGSTVQISGRVLSSKPQGGPLDDDGWLDNLVNTFRRWESDEVAGERVMVKYHDEEQTVFSDEEGYYTATFTAKASSHGGLVWQTATACVTGSEGEVMGTHEILVPGRNSTYGIISDLDDTVIHTGITSLLLAAKLTFLENAMTRKPLDGVAQLYQAFQKGTAEVAVNPIFYISSSPWNLHDLLVDFLRLNEVPAGPLILRDLGIDRTKFIKERGHTHKLDKAIAILDAYPEMPFVLIGDSGQEDPAIYAEVCRMRPDRVRAIYIRDVDPDHATHLDSAVVESIDTAGALGVPMIAATNSIAMQDHAQQIGLIARSSERQVQEGVHADEALPETGGQALKDALNSISPEEPEFGR